MGLRGRTGFLAYMMFGIAVLMALYYVWNNFLYTPPAKITYSSVQGVHPGHMQQWERQMENMQDGVVEEPPIGLNKEIEIQMQNEQRKKAIALQDRIDEERLLEEQAAEGNREKNLFYAQGKGPRPRPTGNGRRQNVGTRGAPRPLLYRPADPIDGDYFAKLERLVHLDLKGAPPHPSYLEKLFPVLSKLGATGLLMEYEDMFPYSGNISVLAANNAFSQSDLQRIQEAAKTNGLEIIPLVQTFGHMEFVLKHSVYKQLRESEYTPQVITPVQEESYTLIFNILDQIVKAHPNSRRIHLGCDEVYELGKGKSSTFIAAQRITPSKLFLNHVSRIARHIKKAFPLVKPLIWDDWLRNVPFDALVDSGLGGLVEPVVWYYQHNVLDRIPESRWEIYGKLFPAVWVASAFKGATGSSQILTNASVHLDNNLQWVSVIRTFGVQKKMVKFSGTILTGWQRYDHFATLCELLPVGLPSLALCLQAIRSGGFGSTEMTNASQALGCSNKVDLEFPAIDKDSAIVTQDCNFPGSAVYYGVQQLWGIMEGYRRDVGLQERIVGWMTDYHVQRGISSPGQMRILHHKLAKVADKLQAIIDPMRLQLRLIYDQYTIEEWVTTNLIDRKVQIMELMKKAKRLLAPQTWPARPFPEPSTEPAGLKMPGGPAQGKAVVNQQAENGGLPGLQDNRNVNETPNQLRQRSVNGGFQQNMQPQVPRNVNSGGVQQNLQPKGLQNVIGGVGQNVQPQFPQSVNGGIQQNLQPHGPQNINPKPVNLQDIINPHESAAQKLGNLAGLGGMPPSVGGAGQQSGGNFNNVRRGGALAQALLPNASFSQGRPSGPGKMQPLQKVLANVQTGLPQIARGLGKYVPGLQENLQGEKPSPNLQVFKPDPQNAESLRQGLQKLPQGPEGVHHLQDLQGGRLLQNQLGFGQNIRGLQQNPQDNGEKREQNELGMPKNNQQLSKNDQNLPKNDPGLSQDGPQFHLDVLNDQKARGHENGQDTQFAGKMEDKMKDGDRKDPQVPDRDNPQPNNNMEKLRYQENHGPFNNEENDKLALKGKQYPAEGNGEQDKHNKLMFDSYFGGKGLRGNEDQVRVKFDRRSEVSKQENDEADYNADDDV
ncbi:hypothetical protein V1264_014149 [Littorina saxatilis]|uniref:beta-N-acetylhexosaminidase n=2 Tax=Littorina saxatilis TaxID=31220 RepID=A0AAN9GJG5_9CAEN